MTISRSYTRSPLIEAVFYAAIFSAMLFLADYLYYASYGLAPHWTVEISAIGVTTVVQAYWWLAKGRQVFFYWLLLLFSCLWPLGWWLQFLANPPSSASGLQADSFWLIFLLPSIAKTAVTGLILGAIALALSRQILMRVFPKTTFPR